MSIENHDPILLSHNMQAFTSTSSFTSGAIPMPSEAVTIGVSAQNQPMKFRLSIWSVQPDASR